MHTHHVNDRRGPIQEENVSTAVAIEISVDVIVAAVLSELNDIITFEKEQIVSPGVFSWVEKNTLWCEGPSMECSHFSNCFLLARPLDGYAK